MSGRDGGAGRHQVLAELVAGYADGELPHSTMLVVERHLADCAACRRIFRIHTAVRNRLGEESTPDVPNALRDRIVNGIASRQRRGDEGVPEWANARSHRAASIIGRLPPLASVMRGPAGVLAAALLAIALLTYALHRPAGDPGADRAGDSAAIRALIQAHADAWNERDARDAAAVLATDAVWVTSEGSELRGRASIEDAHVQWLATDRTIHGGSTHIHPPETVTIHFLRPDVAVVDVESRFVAHPGPGREPTLVDRNMTFMVATKLAGEWRIAQVRNRPPPR